MINNDYETILAELEAARKKINTLEAVLDSTPIPMFSKDEDGVLFFVNKAYEKFFQVNREDVLHKTIKQLDYFEKEEQERYHQDAIDVAHGLYDLSCERLYHSGQKEISTLFSCNGFIVPDSEERGVVGTIVDITKQKNLENELIKKNFELAKAQEDILAVKERLQLMLDTMPLSAAIWSTDGKLQNANAEFLHLFGLEDKEVLEQYVSIISPECQPCGTSSIQGALKYIQETIKTGYKKFEWLHQNLDGDLIPTDVTLIHRNYRGEDIVISYTKDLRKLKASQKEAAEAAEYVQIMLDTISLGANIWDKNYQNVASNNAAAELFDLTSPEEYLEKFNQLSPPFQPDGKASEISTLEKIQTAFVEGRCKFEWLHQKLNGEPIPCEITLIRKKYRGEDVVVGYTHDLRELKKSQKEAAEIAETQQIMLDTMPIAVSFWNKNHELFDCNAEAVKLFGAVNKEEVLKNYTRLSSTLQPDGKSSEIKVKEVISEAFEKGHVTFEWMHTNIHGELLPVEVMLIHAKYQGDDIAVAYLRDLREFKTMLEEIQNARKAAEQSAKVKSEFLANMSHEIRTPMNGVIGLLHLIERTTLDAVQTNFVQKALFSATELLRIIDDILDFSKIEAGKLDMESIPFTLQKITSQMKSVVGHLAKRKNLSLHISINEFANTSILGDPVRLKQVILNFLSNAIKFTSKGSVRLEIQGKCHNNELHCQFAVHDTGIGLMPEQMQNLFSAFNQADNTITRRYGGTGLGLVISKNIIDMMQGDIWVESIYGQGSTFFCTAKFPLATSALQSCEHDMSSKKLMDIEQKRTGHILLVEDNEINQLVAQEILLSMGYTLDIAQNGQEALDRLKENTYDIVLMDIQMPIMDGYTATEKIREQSQYAHLPIIAMSAHAMLGVKEISMKHGMNDHITKPIDIKILQQVLEFWI